MCHCVQWHYNNQHINEQFTAWTCKFLATLIILSVYVGHKSMLQSLEEIEQKTLKRWKRWRESAKQSKLVQAVTLNCIQGVSGSDLDWYTDSCGYILYGLPQSLQICTNVLFFFLHLSSQCVFLIRTINFNISQTHRLLYNIIYLWATCFDCFQSSSGPTKNKFNAYLIYRALWDPTHLHMIL